MIVSAPKQQASINLLSPLHDRLQKFPASLDLAPNRPGSESRDLLFLPKLCVSSTSYSLLQILLLRSKVPRSKSQPHLAPNLAPNRSPHLVARRSKFPRHASPPHVSAPNLLPILRHQPASIMPYRSPSKKRIWMQQDYLSRRDSLLKARKAKYDAAPDEYRRRRRHFYMEHKSRVDAYSSHYYHAHRLQINERRRLKFKDRNVSSKRGISGINSLVSASSIVEASNLNPQDANTGSSGPINSTASKPSPIPKSISSPHYRVIRHTRNRCLDPNTGKLCEWRPHSQCGAVFGPDMLPQNEGLYSFQRTEFKHWAQLKEGVYSEKSGNTFICRLCQQKASGVSATERERGHAAFCRGNPTGGWNDMDRQMEAFRKINSRPGPGLARRNLDWPSGSSPGPVYS